MGSVLTGIPTQGAAQDLLPARRMSLSVCGFAIGAGAMARNPHAIRLSDADFRKQNYIKSNVPETNCTLPTTDGVFA